ncbi:hypothetical protein EDF82_0994 [Raoultella sp. BIGb0399]|uniref:hypothetical protein n=1 Tax=Raoultella sp. BIGb0399 TaxID=2485119 RepID=UPI000F4B7830|nr:hypothetical protein [Raoultella sp. BIGb0399]ROS15885.1 hypothetical protein EDF82_0994 [Raoultella sp. BIGb0399]
MKFTGLQSSSLPDTSDSVKECVNLGQWTLFKSNTKTCGVMFFLRAGKEIFALSETGKVMPSSPISEPLDMTEVFYFSDLPKPESLSNTSYQLAR